MFIYGIDYPVNGFASQNTFMSRINYINYAVCKHFPMLNVFAQLQIICTLLFGIQLSIN